MIPKIQQDEETLWREFFNAYSFSPEQEAQLETVLAVSDTLRVIYLLKEECRIICNKITDQA